MINIATRISKDKSITATVLCKECSHTIDISSFSPATCPSCFSFVPNYTLLVRDREARIEYYKQGKISGIPTDSRRLNVQGYGKRY